MNATDATPKVFRFATLKLGLVALGLSASNAYGQFMLSPVAASETGLGTFSPTAAPLGAMIDQSGLNAPFQNGVTDFDSYFAEPNSNFSKNADKTKWQSDFSFTLPFTGQVDFDLGDTYRLSKLALWNVSIKELSVQVGSSTNGPWQDAGKFALTDQQAFLSLRFSVLEFGVELTGRYVRLEVTSEYPANLNPLFGYVIISEVVLRAAPVGIQRPSLGIRKELNGDLTLTFSGVLQASGTVPGPFENVTGNPLQTYTLPKSQLGASQFFRARQ